MIRTVVREGVTRIQRWGRKGRDFLRKTMGAKPSVGGWQTGVESLEESADDLYETIRRNTTDVDEISRNTGIKPENITKVKRHLFEEAHLLDRYVDYGIPAEMRRFDSHIGIAKAWERLRKGNFTPEDIQLLRHEAAEAWHMRKHGPSYDAAHRAAEKRFPVPQLH